VDVAISADGVTLAVRKGVDVRSGDVLVAVDEKLFRPNELHMLLGDAAKAREVLGWRPEIEFEALVQDMLEADRAALSSGAAQGEAALWRQAG
jgi:GDPmannose 4,6-dehydratase